MRRFFIFLKKRLIFPRIRFGIFGRAHAAQGKGGRGGIGVLRQPGVAVGKGGDVIRGRTFGVFETVTAVLGCLDLCQLIVAVRSGQRPLQRVKLVVEGNVDGRVVGLVVKDIVSGIAAQLFELPHLRIVALGIVVGIDAGVVAAVAPVGEHFARRRVGNDVVHACHGVVDAVRAAGVGEFELGCGGREVALHLNRAVRLHRGGFRAVGSEQAVRIGFAVDCLNEELLIGILQIHCPVQELGGRIQCLVNGQFGLGVVNKVNVFRTCGEQHPVLRRSGWRVCFHGEVVAFRVTAARGKGLPR